MLKSSITGRVSPREIERSELELTARLGGLTIINPKTVAAQKFKSSEKLCKSLIEKLCQVILIKTELQIGRNVHLLKYRRRANRINYVFSPNERMMLCCSRLSVLHTQEHLSWLTTLPLEEHCFCLSFFGFHCACDIIGR